MIAQPAPALRPLNTGELLDQAIRLYRRHFVTFVGIIALVQIPYSLMSIVVTMLTSEQLSQAAFDTNRYSTMDYGAFFSAQALTFLLILVSLILVQGIGTAALTRAIADNYLGRPTSIVDAYQRLGNSWIKLVGALFLVWIFIIGLLIFALIPCIGWFTGPGALIFLGMCVNPLIAAVIVVEKIGVVQTFRRAWDLAKRRFWWLLGFMLILWLFALLVITGPATLVGLLLQGLWGADNLSAFDASQFTVVNTIITSLVNLVTSLLYLPLQLSANTLAYFNLRVRTEGFDLSMLAADDSMTNSTDIAQVTPKAANQSFLTWQDLGNFFALTIAGILLYVIFFGVAMSLGGLLMGGLF